MGLSGQAPRVGYDSVLLAEIESPRYQGPGTHGCRSPGDRNPGAQVPRSHQSRSPVPGRSGCRLPSLVLQSAAFEETGTLTPHTGVTSCLQTDLSSATSTQKCVIRSVLLWNETFMDSEVPSSKFWCFFPLKIYIQNNHFFKTEGMDSKRYQKPTVSVCHTPSLLTSLAPAVWPWCKYLTSFLLSLLLKNCSSDRRTGREIRIYAYLQIKYLWADRNTSSTACLKTRRTRHIIYC